LDAGGRRHKINNVCRFSPGGNKEKSTNGKGTLTQQLKGVQKKILLEDLTKRFTKKSLIRPSTRGEGGEDEGGRFRGGL